MPKNLLPDSLMEFTFMFQIYTSLPLPLDSNPLVRLAPLWTCCIVGALVSFIHSCNESLMPYSKKKKAGKKIMGQFRYHNKLWLKLLNNDVGMMAGVMFEFTNCGLWSACKPESETTIWNKLEYCEMVLAICISASRDCIILEVGVKLMAPILTKCSIGRIHILPALADAQVP